MGEAEEKNEDDGHPREEDAAARRTGFSQPTMLQPSPEQQIGAAWEKKQAPTKKEATHFWEFATLRAQTRHYGRTIPVKKIAIAENKKVNKDEGGIDRRLERDGLVQPHHGESSRRLERDGLVQPHNGESSCCNHGDLCGEHLHYMFSPRLQ